MDDVMLKGWNGTPGMDTNREVLKRGMKLTPKCQRLELRMTVISEARIHKSHEKCLYSHFNVKVSSILNCLNEKEEEKNVRK